MKKNRLLKRILSMMLAIPNTVFKELKHLFKPFA